MYGKNTKKVGKISKKILTRKLYDSNIIISVGKSQHNKMLYELESRLDENEV